MGGPRGQTLRQIARGEKCYNCKALILGALPPLKQGPPGCNERLCLRCQPKEFRILCNIASSYWSVHFIDADGRTRIGPWLLCDSQAHVERILRWGHASPEELAHFYDCLEHGTASSVTLNLTKLQRASLIARGKGWPWNGFELIQMKKAGKYPPERLTEWQERQFLRNRR